jgi:hypothetical protein
MVFGDDLEQQPAPFQQTDMGPIAPECMQKITTPMRCTSCSRRASNIFA